MDKLKQVYDRVIVTLAMMAGVMIALVFGFIVVDVSIRTLGYPPPAFVSAVSEYMLLYITMFAAPWLVRERGHVRIDSFVSYLSERTRHRLDRLIVGVAALLCLIAAWHAFWLGYGFWERGTEDIRSITIPRWALYAPLVIGFGLCAVEFLRFLHPAARFSTDERISAEGEI